MSSELLDHTKIDGRIDYLLVKLKHYSKFMACSKSA